MRIVAVALISMFGLALAAPPGLYAAAPPPDSAFVRVVNASTGSLSAKIETQALGQGLNYAGISPYQVVREGAKVLEGSGKKMNLSLEAGNFYTVALVNGQWIVNQDKTASSLTKSRLSFYNFSDAQASLKTVDGKLTLFNEFDRNHYDMLQVNPVKVQLAVFVGGKKLALPEAQLEANTAYSIMVVGTGSSLQAVWVNNSTQTK